MYFENGVSPTSLAKLLFFDLTNALQWTLENFFTTLLDYWAHYPTMPYLKLKTPTRQGLPVICTMIYLSYRANELKDKLIAFKALLVRLPQYLYHSLSEKFDFPEDFLVKLTLIPSTCGSGSCPK